MLKNLERSLGDERLIKFKNVKGEDVKAQRSTQSYMREMLRRRRGMRSKVRTGMHQVRESRKLPSKFGAPRRKPVGEMGLPVTLQPIEAQAQAQTQEETQEGAGAPTEASTTPEITLPGKVKYPLMLAIGLGAMGLIVLLNKKKKTSGDE